MSGVFSKLSRRFRSDKSTIDSHDNTTAAQGDTPTSDFRGSLDYARLVESVKSVEDEFHAAMHRTQDPVILSALTQSLLIMRSQVEPLLESTASDDDRAALSDLYDSATKIIHDTRTPIDEREDRISSARYKTTVNGNLHETKTVRDYDELLFALEDLSRKISPGDKAEVLAASKTDDGDTYVDELSIDWGDAGDGKISLVFGPTSLLPGPGDKAEVLAASKTDDGDTYVDELSIDWGDAGDGKISLVFGPTSLLPVPNAGSSDSSQHDSENLALMQPDELGESVSEEDLRGFDVEQIIEVVEAIRHDDVKRMAQAKRETPEVYRIASIADGYMVSWYDDEGEQIIEVVEAIRHDDVKRMAQAKRETPEVYRIASIADGYMVSWYDDEGDRPSMKEAVLKAISDDSTGVRGPSREFLEAMKAKLGDGGLR